MAINISAVMDELGAALGTISGLRVFDFPPSSAQPPFAFVNMPESIDYDLTAGRGSDRMTLEIYVGVGNQVDRAARDAMAAYAAGDTPQSIKAAIEAAAVGSSVRVTRAEFAPLTLASGTYAAVVFTVDVAA